MAAELRAAVLQQLVPVAAQQQLVPAVAATNE
jgi:hypothetical protein